MTLLRPALACLLTGSLAGAPARAQTAPVPFAPSADWQVERNTYSCVLARTFADADGRVAHLEVKQQSSDNEAEFLVYTAQVDRRYEPVRFSFGPDHEVVDAREATSMTFGDEGRGVRFEGEIPNAEAHDERAYDGMIILSGFAQPMHFVTGPLEEPMVDLRACFDSLVSGWGFDAEVQRNLSRRLSPDDQDSWQRRVIADYPLDMLRRGQSASLDVLVMVDVEGMPQSCQVLEIDGHEGFIEPTCKSMTDHARFVPALDAQGNPVRSYWTTTITYQIH